MAIKINQLISLLFIVLIIISFSFSARGQTLTQINPENYGGSYKVRTGDIVQYHTTKYVDTSKGITSAIMSANNSLITYKAVIGTVITITIKNITQVKNVAQVFSMVHVVNSRTNLNLTVLTKQTPFLNQGFSNVNDFKNYLTAEQQLNTSTTLPNQSLIYSKIDGDFYNQVLNVSFSNSYNLIASTINWKTGWFQSTDFKDILGNGTLVYENMESMIQPHQNNINSILSYNNLAFILGLTAISIGVFIAIGSFVLYQKSPEKKVKKISFNNYLKKKIKKNQQKENIKRNETDNALKMIEEIIDESKS